MALHVREVGAQNASTIVLLHGGGVSGWMWEPQIEALQGEYHLLVPDLPEHGQSRAEAPLTMQGAAEAVAELIRSRAHGGRAHVVGLSLGGQVTLRLLATAQERVDHAMLSGTLAYHIPGGSLLGLSIRLNMPLLKLDWLMRLQRRRAGIPRGYHEQFCTEARSLGAQTLERIYRESFAAGLPPGLEAVTVPVLVVVGQQEPWISRASARKLVRTIPGARGYLIPGAGHTWNLQAPELFDDVLRAWITDRPLPPALLPV